MNKFKIILSLDNEGEQGNSLTIKVKRPDNSEEIPDDIIFYTLVAGAMQHAKYIKDTTGIDILNENVSNIVFKEELNNNEEEIEDYLEPISYKEK